MRLMKCILCISLVMLFSTSFAKSGTGFLKMSEDCFIVDRIEDGLVICEDTNGNINEIPEDKFKKLPVSGDVVKLTRSGVYKVDRIKTAFRRFEIKRRFDRIFN